MSRSSTDNRPQPAALDADRIARWLHNPALQPAIEHSVGSTNTRLAEQRHQGETVRVLLAEQQTAGRGRQGRQWLSPPGRGLYLSMVWQFARPAREMGPLALVAGLAAAEAVSQHSAIKVGLKWPNDLQVDGRKLGGCLIDLTHTVDDHTTAIIGIGINVDLSGLSGPQQAWTDLAREGGSDDRNTLAATLINALERELELFDRSGFVACMPRWSERDVLRGQAVELLGGGTTIGGRAAGVDEHGGLVLETPAGTRTVRVGEVSVRRTQAL